MAAAWTIEPVVPTGVPLTNVVPKAISNAGHIVGYGTTSSGQTRAFLKYPGGNIVVMGALGGTESRAFDVSDNGVVVGVAKYADGTQKPFFTSPEGGALSAVPALPGWSGVEALAVRPDGTMVGGWARKNSIIISTDQPFWYSNFLGVRDFGLLPPDYISCRMTGMNNRGTGSGSCTGAGKPRAFFIDPLWQMKNLGTLPGKDSSSAVALNHYGRVIGHSWNGSPASPTDRRAYISALNGGALSEINLPSGFLPGETLVSAINNLSQVVGTGIASTPSGTEYSAWLWSNGTATNLRTLPEVISAGWTSLSGANGINDSGWIVGTGQSPAGSGFLLKP